ncbi:hypothetical protein DM860_005674 [Cuscuta australis]|uniref:Ubiquitin-like domain-containing protein n=1 Tax=Cuscuta australis TaxID=267555 RepID=A0A328DSI5_9ASTE|nr:hypothetical protein DM860_005674 [Cuscuta australis]
MELIIGGKTLDKRVLSRDQVSQSLYQQEKLPSSKRYLDPDNEKTYESTCKVGGLVGGSLYHKRVILDTRNKDMLFNILVYSSTSGSHLEMRKTRAMVILVSTLAFFKHFKDGKEFRDGGGEDVNFISDDTEEDEIIVIHSEDDAVDVVPVRDRKDVINLESQKDNDGIWTHVKCRRDIMLKEVLLAYCERKQIDYKDISFVYDGKRLPVRKTPLQLGMKDDDTIEAFRPVHGGGRRQ